MSLCRFQCFDKADTAELRAVARLVAFTHGILQSHLKRIETEIPAQLVNQAFDGKGPIGDPGAR